MMPNPSMELNPPKGEIRLRKRTVILSVVFGALLFLALVLITYVIDLSPLGPLPRARGPWGLPCLSEARCPAPYDEKASNGSSIEMDSRIARACMRHCSVVCEPR